MSTKKPLHNFSIIKEIRSITCVEAFTMIAHQSMKVPQHKERPWYSSDIMAKKKSWDRLKSSSKKCHCTPK
jgi:hypothetical protein